LDKLPSKEYHAPVLPVECSLLKAWVDNLPPKEQPNYKSSPDCVFWGIFELALNDWQLIELVPGKENDSDDNIEVHKLVIKSWVETAEQQIKRVSMTHSALKILMLMELLHCCEVAGATIQTSRILCIDRIQATNLCSQRGNCL
jgi:hypothetical protein